MFELSFSQVMKYMGTTLLLKDVSFNVYSGERVGLVGDNGTGKTTILKLIAGLEPFNRYPGSWSAGYDNGFISIPKEATIAYLDQIPNYPDTYKVEDVLRLAFTELIEVEKSLRDLETKLAQEKEEETLNRLLKSYDYTLSRFEVMGGYDMQEKFKRITTGLKFSDVFLEQTFETLSGGEKTTVVLGKLLMDKPDILLLDEPTNHLDTDSIEWLETYLSSYEGIVLIVSHDRYFLDHAVNKIIEIEDLTTKSYKGNYSSFKSQKDEFMRIQFEDFKEQQKQIKQMESAIKELRDWANRSDNNKFYQRAASLQNRLNRMERIKKPVFDKTAMHVDFTVQQRSGKETIRVRGVSKAYGDKELLREASLLVQYGERVALIGPNGSGKSTLIKMLLGIEEADQGEVSIGASAQVAYLPQEVSFANERQSVLECFRADVVITEGQAREYLAKYMFFGERVFTQVGKLSGGERIRLQLAKLLYEQVNLLILDEPTNHLDINSIETLEEALEDFKGTIFFISHDRYFINTLAKRVIAIEDTKFISYEGNYDAYKDEASKARESIQVNIPSAPKKPQKVKEAPSRVKKEVSISIEEQLESLEQNLTTLDLQMDENQHDYVLLARLFEERQAIERHINLLWSEMDTD